MTEVGKTYKVKFDDCCLEVEFTAKLLWVDPDEGEWKSERRWDNGVTTYGRPEVLEELS